MYKKLMFQTFEVCTYDLRWFKYNEMISFSDYSIPSSTLKGSNWFLGTAGEALTGQTVGALAEMAVAGSYDDAKIRCGENGNRLMTGYVDNAQYLNLQSSHKEIVCNGNEFMLFSKGSLTDSCSATYDSPTGEFYADGGILQVNKQKISTNTSKEDHLDRIVKEKAFDNNVPAGSLYSFSDLERYYLYYDTFVNICTYGSGSDDTSLTYSILSWNPNTKSLERKYFSELKDVSKSTKLTLSLYENKKSCAEMAAILNNESSNEVKAYTAYLGVTGGVEETISPTTTGSTGSAVAQNCSTSGGAKSLGWIVCPVMTWIAEAAENTYDDMIAPSLQIAPQLFSDNNQTLDAWRKIQIIANIFFVVAIITVILSQLTGYGIDNYGLKKSLPRLIVAAILVNLSYYICVGAIDLSTIIGNGLGGLFEDLETATSATVTYSGSGGTDTILVTSLTGAGILGAIVAGGAAIWAAPAIVISLLVSALGVGISIFTLFVLLSVRQAAVVLLVVFAPIAFAANIFQGTKKVFDTWLNVFKALLLVYPITVVLVKGGNYVSSLLMTSGFGSGGFAAAFSAMIVSIAPVFFVPQVLKSAFAGLGNIGAKISGVGSSVRKSATRSTEKAITGSRQWKEFDARHTRGIEQRRAGRITRRLGSRDISSLTEAQRERLATANQIQDKEAERQSAVRYATSAGYLERRERGREEAERLKRENDAIALINTSDRYKRGTDLNTMMDDFLELAELDDSQITAAQRDQRGALFRKIVSTKGGETMMNNIVYKDAVDPSDPTGNTKRREFSHVDASGNTITHILSDAGLARMNEHRLQNGDAMATMAKKGTATSILLNDIASSSVHLDGNGEIDRAYYAQKALTDSDDIANQSSSELERYANYIAPQQIQQLVTNPQYESLVTDYNRRQAIEKTNAAQAVMRRAAGEAYNQERQETFRRLETQAMNNPNGPQRITIGTSSYTVHRPPVDPDGFSGSGSWSVNAQGQPVYTEGNLVWNGETGSISENSTPLPNP